MYEEIGLLYFATTVVFPTYNVSVVYVTSFNDSAVRLTYFFAFYSHVRQTYAITSQTTYFKESRVRCTYQFASYNYVEYNAYVNRFTNFYF